MRIKDLESDITEKRISRTATTANVESFKKIFQQLKQPERRWTAARSTDLRVTNHETRR
jgi:hypothetical protein